MPTLAFAEISGSALPKIPQSVSRGARFRGFTGSLPLRPARLLAPLYGSDWLPSHRGLLLPGFQRSVVLPVAGYDYNSDWTPLLAGLSPAGMAASLAAPARSSSGWRLPVAPGATCSRSIPRIGTWPGSGSRTGWVAAGCSLGLKSRCPTMSGPTTFGSRRANREYCRRCIRRRTTRSLAPGPSAFKSVERRLAAAVGLPRQPNSATSPARLARAGCSHKALSHSVP